MLLLPRWRLTTMEMINSMSFIQTLGRLQQVLTLRYVIGSVTGSTDGTITSWSSSYSVSSSALTYSKIDGIYNEDSEIIAITYHNSSNNKVDVAYSYDFGSNWTLVQDIAMTPGAPSLCNQE